MTVRQRRAAFLLLLLGGVALATMLALSAFRDNLVFFFEPSQVVAGEAPASYPFRLGGLVADDSIRHSEKGLRVRFDVTDGNATVPVTYDGVLPDLFTEGQGVVVRGVLDSDGTLAAEEVLARHDENYMPAEVAASLERNRAAGEGQ